MTRRNVDLRKVFLPSDSIAFIVILIGLFIALFLGATAGRCDPNRVCTSPDLPAPPRPWSRADSAASE